MGKSNIYTKSGDKGMTSLVGGERVPKTSTRIKCYGIIDELNSFIGLLVTLLQRHEDEDFMIFIQNKLFSIGAYLATNPKTTVVKEEFKISAEDVAKIEREIDAIDGALPPIKQFILPGGNRSAAVAHICRTVCRRAERQICRLNKREPVDSNLLIFINRLSDYLYVIARKESLEHGGKENIWNSSCI